jgi:ribosomal protein L6P/L9E
MKIYYDLQINCLIPKNEHDHIILEGPLGKIKIYLGPRYINIGFCNIKSMFYIELNPNYITKQNIKLLQNLNNGLIIGYRKRLIQRGHVSLPITKKNKRIKFKLGFTHLSTFNIRNHLIFRSRVTSPLNRSGNRVQGGSLRIINLYSISYQLVTDRAAQLLRLRKADVYRLTGFRYRIKNRKIRLKIGKKK